MVLEMNRSQEAHHAQESAKNVEIEFQNASQILQKRLKNKSNVAREKMMQGTSRSIIEKKVIKC